MFQTNYTAQMSFKSFMQTVAFSPEYVEKSDAFFLNCSSYHRDEKI